MYCIQMHLYRSQLYPQLNGEFYERMGEIYDLPSVATLLNSLSHEVIWPGDAQVYYLEDLREQNEKAVFQVRFNPADSRTRDLIALFFSVQAGQVHNITVQFPARGDRGVSSVMIGEIKSVVHKSRVPPEEVPLVVEGFMEVGTVRYIRESHLSGFVWINALGRYLHVSEDPNRVREVVKFKKRM